MLVRGQLQKKEKAERKPVASEKTTKEVCFLLYRLAIHTLNMTLSNVLFAVVGRNVFRQRIFGEVAH